MVELSPTVIFLSILLSVPLQFYFSPGSTSDAQFYLHRFFGEIREFYGRFVSSFPLFKYFRFTQKTPEAPISSEHGQGERGEETIDENNMKREEMRELFGGSEEPRHPRPPHIKYRVGQVVRHKIHGYRGVIIAWDERAKAPEWWLRRVHGKEQIDEPNYTILIDTRDRLIPQIAYVLERNVLLIASGAIVHPLVKHYFESFDGTCYKSRPWHKKVYPND